MNDNNLFSVFVNWNTMMLCLGIYLTTYAIRTVTEALWKGAKTNKAWNEIFLPLGPIGTGMLFGLAAQKFPLPLPIADSVMAKMIYGALCGLSSAWVYSRFRSWVRATEAEKALKAEGEKPEDQTAA